MNRGGISDVKCDSKCIKCGSEITVECSGADENEMLKKAEELITSGFGEE